MSEWDIAPVAKVCGADIELGNFIVGDPAVVRSFAARSGISQQYTTCPEASRRLLREFEGLSAGFRSTYTGTSAWTTSSTTLAVTGPTAASDGGVGSVNDDIQDWGRKFLASNGGCVYVDLDHIELCIPEVTSARDHVAAWYAMLRLTRTAMERAQVKMPQGSALQVMVNNSDGYGNSYGSHLSFLIRRETFADLFHRKPHYLMFLASYQASSILFTGAGKVGSENGRAPVDFQLTQRGDFFETLVGAQTTYFRPVVNARDEALCGRGRWSESQNRPASRYSRLHVIFYDNTLNQVSSFLKVGVMQIVLAMIETGTIDLDLLLDDAVEAVRHWSHDPALSATATTTRGREVTAVEHQREYFRRAERFAGSGRLDAAVPGWPLIMEWWDRVLGELERRDMAALSRHVDWALKYQVFGEVVRERGLSWQAPEIKHLDQIYAGLDEGSGLFWAYEKAGLVDQIVTEEEIALRTVSPPSDTRAWTRAMLLRRAAAYQIRRVDWDEVSFSFATSDRWGAAWRIDLGDPTGFTEGDLGELFQREASLPRLLDALEESTTIES